MISGSVRNKTGNRKMEVTEAAPIIPPLRQRGKDYYYVAGGAPAHVRRLTTLYVRGNGELLPTSAEVAIAVAQGMTPRIRENIVGYLVGHIPLSIIHDREYHRSHCRNWPVDLFIAT